MNEYYIKYCPHCIGNGIFDSRVYCQDGTPTSIFVNNYTFCNGIIDSDKINNCIYCNNQLRLLWITNYEWRVIQTTTTDYKVLFALNDLKVTNPIEFGNRMTQYQQAYNIAEQTKIMKKQSTTSATANIPKCPTCGSTNVRKISATKRWVGVGLFGLASSDATHTMQCSDCGTKW